MRLHGTFYQCVAQILAVFHAGQEARQADFRARHFRRRVAVGGLVLFNENEADDAEAQQPLPFQAAGELHDGDRAVKLRPFDGFQRVFIAVSDIDQRRVKGFLQEVSRAESARLQWVKGYFPAVERHAGLAGDDAWRREFHLAMLQAALREQILYALLQQQVACRTRLPAARSFEYGFPIALRPCRRQQKTCQQHD